MNEYLLITIFTLSLAISLVTNKYPESDPFSFVEAKTQKFLPRGVGTSYMHMYH